MPENVDWSDEKKALVEKGLKEAKEGKFSENPPDLDEDQKLIDEMED